MSRRRALTPLEEFESLSYSEALMALAARGDPGVLRVGYRDVATSVAVAPDQRLFAFTVALAGCQGVAVLSRLPDDTSLMTFTHYPPTMLDDNVDTLEHALMPHRTTGIDGIEHTAIIAVPRPFDAEHRERAQTLLTAVRGAVGPLAAEHVVPYLATDDLSSGRSDLMVLHFSGTPGEPVRFAVCGGYAGQIPSRLARGRDQVCSETPDRWEPPRRPPSRGEGQIHDLGAPPRRRR